MQKKYSFAPLGGANSATKQLIFGGNATKFYKIRLKAADNTRMPAFSEDRLASLKNEYTLAAKTRSNLRYGYVRGRGKCPTSAPGEVSKLRGRHRSAAAGKTISIDKSSFGFGLGPWPTDLRCPL